MDNPERTAREKTEIEIPLPNGLAIKILDTSRKLAGDRWLVKMIAKIEIPIESLRFEAGEPAPEKIIEELGKKPVFTIERARHFIDEREKDEVFKKMVYDLKQTDLPYLGQHIFPKKYILKTYFEKLQRKSLEAMARQSSRQL